MTLRDVDLRSTYDSDEDNILDDFYIPALANAVRYDRLAGYYSSSSLAASAIGMSAFIRNGGIMRLVTSVQITESDQQAIKEGLYTPEEVIARELESELDSADQMQRNHVSALAWMIANKKLEIKIAVPTTLGRNEHNSIYHQKVGILYDDQKNVVTFSGSVNETGRAWHENIEELKVFCSWKPGQDEYGSKDQRRFEKFWYGRSNNTRIYDLPDAIHMKLIQNAPNTMEKAILGLGGEHKTLNLRDYQKDAVKNWYDRNGRGVFEMATGTGKTITAIACIRSMYDELGIRQSLTIIACPYKHLVNQWVRQLKKAGIDARTAYKSSTSWQSELGNMMLELNDGVINRLVIVTTHATFAGDKFMDMVKTCRADTLLIVDEVHKIGSKHHSVGLLDLYKYRLGLSATPERYFDDDGTKTILDYFGGIVYEYGLDDALAEGYLTRYEFFPHVVHMTPTESKEYGKYSIIIAREKSKEHPDHELLKKVMNKRAKIVKSASNKMIKLPDILEEIGDMDHCLIYCVDRNQLQEAASILHKKAIIFHRFTETEETDERDRLISEFDSGIKDVLLAIKCLDEGVDIPSTKSAVILASSGNPIEFIQRRGRILRTYNGKDRAYIHDIIVLPMPLPSCDLYLESEKNMIRKELDRIEEFAGSSDNPEHSMEIIQTYKTEYGL